jgi:hypothetical protein
MLLNNLFGRLFDHASQSPRRANDLGEHVEPLNGQCSGQSYQKDLPLVAYRIKESPFKIEVASASRGWMDRTNSGFANRCLPLRIANQAGWFILNPEQIEVVWNGGEDLNCLTFTRGTMDERFFSSHFGHGILTWKIPYLFRTPPRVQLVRAWARKLV